MAILIKVEGKINKKTEGLEASGENIEKDLLKKSDIERLKTTSGLSVIEESFKEVGYSIDTLATQDEYTFLILEKHGKRKPEFSEEMNNYIRADFIIHQKLKLENKPEDYEIKLCTICKEKRALYKILPQYIYFSVYV